MAISLRSFAAAIEINGPFSVLGDFYGFRRKKLPPDPQSDPVSVSLRDQIQRLQGRYFNLNLIRVGSDKFTASDDIQIDYSIYKLRNVYRSVGLGVGRVFHWAISTADANGFDNPTSFGELEDLTDEWSVPNDALDLFIPYNMAVSTKTGIVLGFSPIDGPCDKAGDETGVICGLWGDEQTARTLAHETGHYLGLTHNHDGCQNCPSTTADQNNLMAQSCCALSTRDSILLTGTQGINMTDHCFTKSGS